MSNFRDNVSDTLGSTRSNVESTLNDAKARAREGVDHLKTAAADARSFMDQKMHDTRDQVNEFGETLRGGWDHVRNMEQSDYEEVWDGVKTQVRQNPGPAILVAAGIGLAIGMLVAMSSTPRRR